MKHTILSISALLVMFPLIAGCAGTYELPSNINSSTQEVNIEKTGEVKITDIAFRLGRTGEDIGLVGSYEGIDELQINDTRIIYSEYQEPVEVKGREHVEIVLHFDNDAIDGGEFIIIDSEGKEQPVTHAGGGQSWIIENGIAKAVISPWVHVPYNEDGVMELMLEIESISGKKYVEKWKFMVNNAEHRD